MKKLFLIPARGGSKGLPRKNILPLAGKPMICYSIDAAKGALELGDVLCVSTEDPEIIQVVQDYGIDVPFKRPAELASDTANTEQVIAHAIEWYRLRDIVFDIIILLQPTSPLRNTIHVKEALSLWSEEIDMVVSVKVTDSNPYYVLFEEDEIGLLKKSKGGVFTRRQDCPEVYELNGATYVINVSSLIKNTKSDEKKIRKYLMDKIDSIDVDDQIDFDISELILKNRLS